MHMNLDAITSFLLRSAPAFFEWAMMLLPLTIYLLWLGFEVGRKKQPYYLTGRQDALLLFLALSGLLLLGPPTWVIARFASGGSTRYFIAFTIYALVVVVLGWLWIRSRRQGLVIYNIEPSVFATSAKPALDSLGMSYQMTPGRISLGQQQLLIDLEPTPSLYCVTLSWEGDAALWSKLEAGLRDSLAEVTTTRNPAGAFIPLYGAVMLCFISMSTVIFVWYYAYLF